jgi:ubiquinol-cytochrome c reductase cytochrome b subunit
MRILKSHPLLKLVNHYLIDATQPSNISYLWNFGSLLAVCLVIQIATGVTLAMHYNPSVLEAFNSVEHIMRDVNNGWLIRYLHSNTASAFFFLVYLHIGRGFYYGSYRSPRTLVWVIGTIILIAMIGTGFLGYVLPYGQMSLWGATVITNLISAIPWIGQDIVEFIWGGFSVNNATLNRFFALHYLLPFVLAALVLMHLIALHDTAGSSNPLGISGNYDRVTFAPYFLFKDLITIFLFIFVLSIFVFFMPNVLGDSDNYIMANPMQTPAAIVPEWYLLPFYAILRSIPNKLLGVVTMFAALVIITILPITDLGRSKGLQFRPLSKIIFFIFVANFLILMQLGAKHVESPFIEFGQLSTLLYFGYFIMLVPLISLIENTLVDLSTVSRTLINCNNTYKSINSVNTIPLIFKQSFHSTSHLSIPNPINPGGKPFRFINGKLHYWIQDDDGNFNWVGEIEGSLYKSRIFRRFVRDFRYSDLSPPTAEERKAAGISDYDVKGSVTSTQEVIRNNMRMCAENNILRNYPKNLETAYYQIKHFSNLIWDPIFSAEEKKEFTRELDKHIKQVDLIRQVVSKSESSTDQIGYLPLTKNSESSSYPEGQGEATGSQVQPSPEIEGKGKKKADYSKESSVTKKVKDLLDNSRRGGPGGDGPSGSSGGNSSGGTTGDLSNPRVCVEYIATNFLVFVRDIMETLLFYV